MMFAVLHEHGPAECPARTKDDLLRFSDAISDQTAQTHRVNVVQRFVDVNCTGTLAGHMFGAPIHHSILIVESEKKENVQQFVKPIPCEIVGIRSLSEVLPK